MRRAVKTLTLSVAIVLSVVSSTFLFGCAQEEQPDLSGYRRIAELATLDCTYHNVAEIYNDGTDIIFGINVGYKKVWFEYDGKIKVGVDASKVKVSGPDSSGVVTIAIPDAEVLGLPDVDVASFSDLYYDKGLLTSITTDEQAEALKAAQDNMVQSVESNTQIMTRSKDRAKELLEQYVKNVGEAIGKTYEVRFVDAE